MGRFWFVKIREPNATTIDDEPFLRDSGNHGKTITAWRNIFSPLEKSILLKKYENDSVRKIRLIDFDFEKGSEYLLMNINDGAERNAAPFFKPYSKAHNRNIVQRTAKSFKMPESEQDNLVSLVDYLYQHREMSLG